MLSDVCFPDSIISWRPATVASSRGNAAGAGFVAAAFPSGFSPEGPHAMLDVKVSASAIIAAAKIPELGDFFMNSLRSPPLIRPGPAGCRTRV
jgi:hypothetical protein